MYWGLHRHSALFYGSYWLAKTHSLAEAPTPVPEFSAPEQQMQTIMERWQDFEQKTRAGQPAEIELSADDVNGLIAASPDLRGKVFASLEGNQLRLETSLPIGKVLGRAGYYFNGDVIVETTGEQSLQDPHFSRITINGEQVPTDFLSWKYRSRQLRDYLADLRDDMLLTKPFPEGEDKILVLWQVLIHVVNHGTDHRAQLLRLLNDLGVKTEYQDYIFYVFDHP